MRFAFSLYIFRIYQRSSGPARASYYTNAKERRTDRWWELALEFLGISITSEGSWGVRSVCSMTGVINYHGSSESTCESRYTDDMEREWPDLWGRSNVTVWKCRFGQNVLGHFGLVLFRAFRHLPDQFGIDGRIVSYGRKGETGPTAVINWGAIFGKYKLGQKVHGRFDSRVLCNA